MKHRHALSLGLAAIALAAPATASAGVVTRGDSGPDAASITDTRDEIRVDLGGGTAFGTIGWDGVQAAQSAPNVMPPNQFLNARGVLFSTPGTGLEVSSPDDSGLDVRFGALDPGYPGIFKAFSGDQIFRAIGSNVVEVDFFVNGTSTPATTRGFAVAFSDVDRPNTSKVEAWDAKGAFLGVAFAPPADNGVSLASIVADGGAPIAKVRITSGTTALGAGVLDNLPAVDVVAMDDFILGNTVAAPDLAVTAADAPDPVVAGANLTYTVTVTNAGAGASPASGVAWSLPAGVAGVSAAPSQGTCATATSCDLGAIAAGAAATVTIVTTPTAAGAAQATFWTTSANDRNAANDTTSATTTVTAPPAADTTGPKLKIGNGPVTITKNGDAVFAITCPTGETICKGAGRLTTAGTVGLGRLRLRLDLGAAKFTIAGGRTAQVKFRLTLAERAVLTALGRMNVRLDLTVADAAGNTTTASKTLNLRARPKR